MSRPTESGRGIEWEFGRYRRLVLRVGRVAAVSIVIVCVLSGCRRSEQAGSAESASARNSIDSISTQPAHLENGTRPEVDEAALTRLFEARRRVYADVDRIFERADFYRPDESSAPAELIQLCPLIVQEVRDDDGSDRRLRIVGPVNPDTASARWDAAHATVFFDESEIRIVGRRHRRIRYAWRIETTSPGEADVGEVDVESDAGTWRGFEMVLGSDMFPAIYSLLPETSEPSPLRTIFVASSIEKSAMASFGEALEGRHAVVEPDVSDHPDVVVARVLDDGPMPMGPFAYAAAENGAITTLLCRCMPSQVRDFSGNTTYRLQHAPATISAVWRGHAPGHDTEAWASLRIPPQF
ncbi:MAG: hypothetical protein KF841_12920 [Phycisphaerae bacterium]|nr:hypothetical protein [Phycisphaerae bacterium]